MKRDDLYWIREREDSWGKDACDQKVETKEENKKK